MHAPTAEQQAIVDAALTGDSLVIEAGAGTGKTSTLKLIADALAPKRGLYLAYNKAIQTDAAASFPSNVQCKTAHSLAYGGMMRLPEGKALMGKLRGPRVPSWTAAKQLQIPTFGFRSGEVGMGMNACASMVMQTVSRFCNSADTEITGRHVPREFEGDAQAQFQTFIVPFARKAWNDINTVGGTLKFTHDHYLKIWALTNPRLSFDFILFDEAQDANPCIAGIVESQAGQVIMVGDAAQAIYGWRGAVDAMSKFNAVNRRVLSQSFRFGAAIAAEANKFLSLLDAPLRLTGFDKIDSTVEAIHEPDAILCRTNAGVIEHAMTAQATGRKVAIVGGTKEIESFTRAAQKLMDGGKTEHADLIAFKTWGEVVDHANEAEGRDLKVMVNLITNYGPDAVLDVCAASCDEASADLIVSTAHKAKGREWNRVRIATDFRAPEEGETPQRSEMMLAYVAVTRAKIALDNAGLAWIDMVAA